MIVALDVMLGRVGGLLIAATRKQGRLFAVASAVTMRRVPRPGAVWLAVGAVLLGCVLAPPAAAQSRARSYPYTLIDPGTFGGPSSYLDEPSVSITRNGAILGTADTTTPDPDLPASDFSDGYVQHAFVWTGGHLVDLGALAPAATNNSQIYGLNGNGLGVGASENGLIDPLTGLPAEEATVFQHGHVIDLGTLGGHESFTLGVNSHGQVAGISTNTTLDPFPDQQVFFLPFIDETRGFVWRDGVMHDLGTLGGPEAQSYVQNQRGQIAGWSDTNSTPNATTGIPTIEPFLWQRGRLTGLGSLGGTIGQVGWLNDGGEVVGISDLKGDQNAHPFLWRNGKMIDLGTPDGNFGFANYINQRGDAAGGYFASDGNFHGILWRGRHMIDLRPVGAAQAFGNAVNDRGQVVGNQDDSNFNEVSAALWTGGHGYDLNTLVAPSVFQMLSADQINNQGTIFGHGVYTTSWVQNTSICAPQQAITDQPPASHSGSGALMRVPRRSPEGRECSAPGSWHSRSRLPRRGVAPRPGDRVALALHGPVHHAGHCLHRYPIGGLAVQEIQEGAELGGRDHVRAAVRVHVAQVVEDENDPGASLGLRGRFGVDDVLFEGGELGRLLDRRYRADRVRVRWWDGVGGGSLEGEARGSAGVVVVAVVGGVFAAAVERRERVGERRGLDAHV
jgi:probable HAF family extracellular repeat protein